MTYGKRTLIAVDQLLNTLLGGWPDETLSSRCYRWARDGVRAWPRRVVDGLFFWQREHCKSSYESEREGRQSPPELRRVTPGSVTRYSLFRQRRGRLEPPPPARRRYAGPRSHTML